MNFKKISSTFGFLAVLPVISYAAASKLVYQCQDGKGLYGNCSWNDLIAATRNAVNYITMLTFGVLVIVIAYIGFELLTSEGDPRKRSEAKGRAIKVLIGMVFIICAWAIVNLIATGLGVTAFKFM